MEAYILKKECSERMSAMGEAAAEARSNGGSGKGLFGLMVMRKKKVHPIARKLRGSSAHIIDQNGSF